MRRWKVTSTASIIILSPLLSFDAATRHYPTIAREYSHLRSWWVLLFGFCWLLAIGLIVNIWYHRRRSFVVAAAACARERRRRRLLRRMHARRLLYYFGYGAYWCGIDLLIFSYFWCFLNQLCSFTSDVSLCHVHQTTSIEGLGPDKDMIALSKFACMLWALKSWCIHFMPNGESVAFWNILLSCSHTPFAVPIPYVC